MFIHKYQRRGDYHAGRKESCQDAIAYFEDDTYALAVIADGVTGCVYGKQGATCTCEAIKDFVKRERSNLLYYAPEKTAYLLMEHILYFLEKLADLQGHDVQEYAATFAFALIEKDSGRTVLGNLGDCVGFLLYEGGQTMILPMRRHGGQPCLTTTPDAYKAMVLKGTVLSMEDTVMLCTDGLIHGAWSLIRDPRMDLRVYEELDAALDASNEPDDCSYITVTRTRNYGIKDAEKGE